MKVLITGNREKDLCKNTTELLEANGYTVETLSRTNDCLLYTSPSPRDFG